MSPKDIPQLNFEDNFCNSINGKLRTTEHTRHGINPATEKLNPKVPVATIEDVGEAVTAARHAFSAWSNWSYAARRTAIHSFAAAIDHYQEDFAKLLTKEQGKPVSFLIMSLGNCQVSLYDHAEICSYALLEMKLSPQHGG